MVLLYDIRTSPHTSGYDRSVVLPIPSQAGMTATCTNGPHEVLTSVPNIREHAERVRIISSLDEKAKQIQKSLPKDQLAACRVFGDLMALVGVTGSDYDAALDAFSARTITAYQARAWADAGRPSMPPPFVWARK